MGRADGEGMKTTHGLTMNQIEDLRAGVRGLAADLGTTLEKAWDAMFMPEYVWAAMVDARDAVGPDERPVMDLFAADSTEREAAAQACMCAIKAAVLCA